MPPLSRMNNGQAQRLSAPSPTRGTRAVPLRQLTCFLLVLLPVPSLVWRPYDGAVRRSHVNDIEPRTDCFFGTLPGTPRGTSTLSLKQQESRRLMSLAYRFISPTVLSSSK